MSTKHVKDPLGVPPGCSYVDMECALLSFQQNWDRREIAAKIAGNFHR